MLDCKVDKGHVHTHTIETAYNNFTTLYKCCKTPHEGISSIQSHLKASPHSHVISSPHTKTMHAPLLLGDVFCCVVVFLCTIQFFSSLGDGLNVQSGDHSSNGL